MSLHCGLLANLLRKVSAAGRRVLAVGNWATLGLLSSSLLCGRLHARALLFTVAYIMLLTIIASVILGLPSPGGGAHAHRRSASEVTPTPMALTDDELSQIDEQVRDTLAKFFSEIDPSGGGADEGAAPITTDDVVAGVDEAIQDAFGGLSGQLNATLQGVNDLIEKVGESTEFNNQLLGDLVGALDNLANSISPGPRPTPEPPRPRPTPEPRPTPSPGPAPDPRPRPSPDPRPTPSPAPEEPAKGAEGDVCSTGIRSPCGEGLQCIQTDDAMLGGPGVCGKPPGTDGSPCRLGPANVCQEGLECVPLRPVPSPRGSDPPMPGGRRLFDKRLLQYQRCSPESVQEDCPAPPDADFEAACRDGFCSARGRPGTCMRPPGSEGTSCRLNPRPIAPHKPHDCNEGLECVPLPDRRQLELGGNRTRGLPIIREESHGDSIGERMPPVVGGIPEEPHGDSIGEMMPGPSPEPRPPMVGTSYCTYAPDHKCYTSGRPACCLDEEVDCPREKPKCDADEPCVMVDCMPGSKLVGADSRGCGGTCEPSQPVLTIPGTCTYPSPLPPPSPPFPPPPPPDCGLEPDGSVKPSKKGSSFVCKPMKDLGEEWCLEPITCQAGNDDDSVCTEAMYQCGCPVCPGPDPPPKPNTGEPTWQVQTFLTNGTNKGDTRIDVEKMDGMAVGQTLMIGARKNAEFNRIKGFGSIELETPLTNAHPPGTAVTVVASDGDAYVVKERRSRRLATGRLE